MADGIFNIAKGTHGYYASLPGTNDALIAVPIDSVGVEADAVLEDYDTLAALLAGASNEEATMGRVTLAGVTSTVDDVSDTRVVDCNDPSWAAAPAGSTAKLIVCYDPDTTAGTDADLIPLYHFDFVTSSSSVPPVVAQVNALGLASST